MNAKRLLVLVLMAIFATSAWAYDFSAVAPSGQTLYYNIVNGEAQITYQNYDIYGTPSYNNLSGTLFIPSSVTNGGIVYSVTFIGDFAFRYCSGLTSVTIPNSVTSIGNSAFCYCSGLTSVSIPNSVTSIGDFAFDGCVSLTTVNIPNSVTSIGNAAFGGCSGLISVTIPNSVTSIGFSAFSFCSGLTSVVISNSVTTIGSSVFQGCSSLTSVTIPNSVISIDEMAFSSCSALTSVTIPNSVISIGYNAFAYCSALTSVTIPNSVTSIGGGAFWDCIGLTSVTIPNSVTSIGEDAFLYVRHIEYYGEATGLPWGAISMNGIIVGDFVLSNTQDILLAYIGTGGTVSIPNTVTMIGELAFFVCRGLISVTIPNSVTSIGNSAFYGCSGLTSITIPAAVTSIGAYTFSGCSGLTSVTIPDGVNSIGNYAFSGCSGLTSITIPDGVTSIGERAFYNCSGLDTVFMEPETVPSLGDHCFDNNTDNRVFIIPCASYDSYYNHADWYSYRESLNEHGIDLSIIVASNSPYYGSVNVVSQSGHNVSCDSTTIVYAEDDEHCVFDHWSNGNTANPDTLHLVGDSTVTAIFAPNQYVLTVQSADESLGSVAGSGTYDYLDTVEISATGINHHHFLHWNDGNRDNPRQVVVTGDLSFTAFFAIDTHTVHVETNDIARGMVESTGTEFVYGTPCTVTATAYTGYTFAGWSNGVTANPYTFAVLNDVELTALFVAEGEQTYTVTVVSDDPTMGTVSGGGQALDGGTVTIRAVGNPGYHFLRWNDNNTDSVRTVEVHGNVTYTAYFASNSTEAIDDVNESNIKVYAIDGRIVVEGRENRPVWVLDMYGRVVDNGQLPSGVYLVKVGNLPARKVVVIR